MDVLQRNVELFTLHYDFPPQRCTSNKVLGGWGPPLSLQTESQPESQHSEQTDQYSPCAAHYSAL